jgi:hypothetical protein
MIHAEKEAVRTTKTPLREALNKWRSDLGRQNASEPSFRDLTA